MIVVMHGAKGALADVESVSMRCGVIQTKHTEKDMHEVSKTGLVDLSDKRRKSDLNGLAGQCQHQNPNYYR